MFVARAQVQYPCGEVGTRDVFLLNHATSCNQYVLCIGGQPVIRNCAPGFRFDVEGQECSTQANCSVEDLPCPLYNNPSELIFQPHSTECSTYYMCANGELMERQCWGGMHWDREQNWCTFPDSAMCPVST